MTRPTLASCVWTDGNLSCEGRYGASGVATLHSTLGVSAFPEFVSPMGGHPSRYFIFIFIFGPMVSGERGLEIKANSFPLPLRAVV